MAAKITGFKIYPRVSDDDGSIVLRGDIAEMLSQIEYLINDDQLDEEYVAVYDTIYEVLSSPVGTLMDTVKSILMKIITDHMETNIGDVPEHFIKDEPETEEEMRRMIHTTPNACDLPAHATHNQNTGEVPTLDEVDDISDEEMLAEYRKPEILHED